MSWPGPRGRERAWKAEACHTLTTDEVCALVERAERAERERDETARLCSRLLLSIQRYQPGGSPPPGGPEEMAEAVLSWLAQRAGVQPGGAHCVPPVTWADTQHPAERERDEALADVARGRRVCCAACTALWDEARRKG